MNVHEEFVEPSFEVVLHVTFMALVLMCGLQSEM